MLLLFYLFGLSRGNSLEILRNFIPRLLNQSKTPEVPLRECDVIIKTPPECFKIQKKKQSPGTLIFKLIVITEKVS